METMTQIELVDRENNVITTGSVPLSAFPLTVRLANQTESELVRSPAPHLTTQSMPRWRQMIMTPGGTLAVVAISVALFAVHFYANAYAESAKNVMYFGIIGIITGMTVWTSLWALIGRMTRRDGRFREQLLWTCLVIAGGIVVSYIIRWLEFLIPGSTIGWVIAGLVGIAFFASALYGHLSIASRLPTRKLWYATALIVLVGLIFGGAGASIEADSFSTTLEYNSTLEPLDARFIPAKSVESFTAGLDEIQKDIQKMQQKK